MTSDDLDKLVALLRTSRTDLADVEVKAANGGTPKSLRPTLSAFSNGHGGVVLLGLDESNGFEPVPDIDIRRLQDRVAGICADDLEPPVRADIDVQLSQGMPVLVVTVPELDPRHKPCFVKEQGEYRGSYLRGGDGDRRMTEHEIHLLHANRGQPRDDREPVPEATLDDLDSDSLAALLRRVRERQPRAFAVSDEIALQRLNVAIQDGDRLVPTLGGLLSLGQYPQQFFPQLNVTLIAVPGTSLHDVPDGSPRFLDNRSFDGPIPTMLEEAVAAILRNMSVRAYIDGTGRRDVFDFPVEAVREAITNALLHRDYSTYARGTQVQVEMYTDRLVVKNPGGLFGVVTEDSLGSEGVSSSRNSVLAKLLQDVSLPGTDRVVCENRGSGIPTMIKALRRAGLTPPEFRSRIRDFRLTIPKHALLDPDTVAWIDDLGQLGLSAAQRMILALLAEGRTVTNQVVRNLGVDGRRATAELAGLVTQGLAVRVGERRHARYVLNPVRSPVASGNATATGSTKPGDRDSQILALIQPGETLSRQEIEARSGLGTAMVNRVMARLEEAGVVIATAPPRSRNRRYRRTE